MTNMAMTSAPPCTMRRSVPERALAADRRRRQIVPAAPRARHGRPRLCGDHGRVGRRRSAAGRKGRARLCRRRHAARRRQRARRHFGHEKAPAGSARHHPHRLRQHRDRGECGQARRRRLSRQAGRCRRRVAAALLALDNKKIEPPENPMSADRVRWEHIQRIYELCGRNVSETARRLNMHRRTLQRILAKRAPKCKTRSGSQISRHKALADRRAPAGAAPPRARSAA
jgi:hypothetical protein